jgi:outer membrane protein TolC
MMKKYYMGLSVLLFSISASSQLTLDQVLINITERTPEYQLKQLIPQQSSLEIKNIGHSRLPQIGISGQATYQSDVTFLDVDVPGIQIPRPDEFQYKVQGEVSQVLYDGGTINALQEAARLSSKIEQSKVDMSLEMLQEQGILLYFTLLELDKAVEVMEYKRDDLKAREEMLSAGVENGVVLESELLSLQAAILELDQEKAKIETQRQSALDHLALMTNQQYDNSIELDVPQSAFPQEISREVLTYHKLIDLQMQAVEATQKVNDTKLRPKVNAFGQIGVGKPGLNFLDSELSEYYVVGLRMQLQMSGLYSKNNDKQINRITQEKIQTQKDSYDRQWNAKLKAYQNDLNLQRELIQRNTELLDMRTSIKNVAQVQLENGVMSSADYIIRLNEENRAKINLDLARIRQIKIQYLILHHTGKI